MAYNTTASLDKLTTRTNYVDFGKCQYRFGQFSLSKKDSTYLVIKLKVFKNDDKKDLRLVQNLTMEEADFNHFMRLRNELVIAGENVATQENLSSVVIPKLSKDMDEQLKLAHKVVDLLDRANRKVCVTLLRYSVDNPESSYARVWLFARKQEYENLQQFLLVNYKIEEFISLLDVLNSG